MIPLAIFQEYPEVPDSMIWHVPNIAEEMERAKDRFHLVIDDGEHNPWFIMFKDDELYRHICIHENPYNAEIDAYGTNYNFEDYINIKLYVIFGDLYDHFTENTTDHLVLDSLYKLSHVVNEEEFMWKVSLGPFFERT